MNFKKWTLINGEKECWGNFLWLKIVGEQVWVKFGGKKLKMSIFTNKIWKYFEDQTSKHKIGSITKKLSFENPSPPKTSTIWHFKPTTCLYKHQTSSHKNEEIFAVYFTKTWHNMTNKFTQINQSPDTFINLISNSISNPHTYQLSWAILPIPLRHWETQKHHISSYA